MGEDILSMGNILSEDEAAKLFADDSTEEDNTAQNTEKQNTPEKTQEEPKKDENKETTEVNPDDLFVEEPESVGSNKGDKSSQESTQSSDDDGGTSPNTTENFYSSIATALKDEGVFPDLDDSEIEKIKTPEDFRDIVDKQVKSELNDVQQRVNDALKVNVPPNVIKQYEDVISYLNNITEDQISEESDQGETLRRQLLQQDFINRGYPKDRAVKMAEKLFDAGEDVDEAKAALNSNKQYFNDKYKGIIDEKKAIKEQEAQAQKKQAEDLRKSILESDKAFGIPMDKASRKKVFDTISKPVWKDPETGDYYTAIQKYRRDNPNEFIKNVGYLYTLTNGFKDIESLVKPQTKKEVKSKLRELEHTINNTARKNDGSLKYVSNDRESNGSLFDQGFALDIK